MFKKIFVIIVIIISISLLIGLKISGSKHYYISQICYSSNINDINNITIGIIDGAIDTACFGDFKGVISQKYIVKSDLEEKKFNKTHGTHLSSIIGGIPKEDKVLGLASGVKINSYVVSDGLSKVKTSDIVNAIDVAIADNVDIINLSLGSETANPNEALAISDALKHNIVVVASFGNGGRNQGMFPALYDGVISVGAIDKDNDIALFSNYGPQLNLVAPGADIPGVVGKNKYEKISGTSQSTAIVSSLVCLMKAKNKLITPAQVKDIILSTCTKVGTVAEQNSFGNGMVNFDLALSKVK